MTGLTSLRRERLTCPRCGALSSVGLIPLVGYVRQCLTCLHIHRRESTSEGSRC